MRLHGYFKYTYSCLDKKVSALLIYFSDNRLSLRRTNRNIIVIRNYIPLLQIQYLIKFIKLNIQ